MPLLDFNLENIPDLTTMKAGEYRLTCLKEDTRVSKNGKPMWFLLLSFSDHPSAMDIRHNVMLPTSEDDEKTKIQKLNRIKDIYKAFGIDFGQHDTSVFVGRDCFASVTEKEQEEYGLQNNVKSFIARR